MQQYLAFAMFILFAIMAWLVTRNWLGLKRLKKAGNTARARNRYQRTTAISLVIWVIVFVLFIVMTTMIFG